MKKIAIIAAIAVAATAAFAETTWALLNTDPADSSDTTGGYADSYKAYLCTKAAAADLFGGNDNYSDITAYLSENHVNYASGMTALDAYKFDEGQYSFSKYFVPGTLGSEYIAVVAYAGGAADMFRVFESAASGGSLTFDPDVTEGGRAGAWTTAAPIPEPTSGLLLLLGVAGLALRRRRG